MLLGAEATGGGPNWAEIVTGVSTAVLAVGVPFALLAVREAAKTREVAAAAALSERWDSPALREARRLAGGFRSREALRDAYLAARKDRTTNFYSFLTELDFFEDLGTLARLRGVSAQWIELRMRSSVLNRWDLWEMTIMAIRERQPTAYENFGRLRDLLILRRDYPRRWDRWCYRWNVWCHGQGIPPPRRKGTG